MFSRLIFLPFVCVSHLLVAQSLADFETTESTPTLTPTGSVVVNNPDQDGNSSAKAAYYQKAAGNWQAIYLNFAAKKNVGNNDQLTFKLRSSTQGRVFVKVINAGVTIHEDWAPDYNSQPLASRWTECVLNISTITDQEFDRIEVNASVDNTAVADVYVDDFKLTNSLSPAGEPIIDVTVSSGQVTLGEPVQFDASASVDLDGSIVSYSWQFGDGTSAPGNVVEHVYTSDGIFKASLLIEDNEGNTASWNSSINVLPTTGKIGTIKFITTNTEVHEKIEGIFLIKGDYSNVYDPDIIKVDAIITQPNASTLTVPCFFYKLASYRPDQWTQSEGAGYWMLRFSSPQSGQHQVQLQVTDADGTITSVVHPITINAGAAKGIIKMDSQNKQYYRHTTGELFYPLGINAAWDNTSNYTNIINNLGNGGANLVRYWQVPFDRQGLEWRNGSGFYKGLGVYSQEAAAEQDSIFALCEANNIFLQMTIFQHGMFSENVNSNWPDNPYNSANGGMLTRAEQYFYNAEAKAHTKKLLRYIVARWGYSKNLFAWELFNEVNFTGIHPNQSAQWYPALQTWHNEMGQYLKQQDPFDHPVTTSSDETHLADFDKLTGLDNVQYHLYNTSLLNTQITKDKSLLNSMTRVGLINGEYGLDVTTADVPFNIQRLSIWTGIMTQVPHLMWLWENYLDSDWADLFIIPSEYLAGEDFVSEGDINEWSFEASKGTNSLSTLGFSSDSSFYGLIYEASNTSTISNGVLHFSGLPSGNYTITAYDVVSGTFTTQDVDIPSSKEYSLPPFSQGSALKIKFNYAIILGAEEVKEFAEISLYPNPTHDSIEVDISKSPFNEVDVYVYSVLGEEIDMVTVRRTTSKDGKVKIELKNKDIQSGVYFVRLMTDSRSTVRKVIYKN